MAEEINLCCLASVDSTMAEAKRLASCGNAGETTVVTADMQSSGRGRLGRVFDSAPGGVYLSIACRPPCRPSDCVHIPALVALAVKDAVEETSKAVPDLKWPNDLLFRGKKICGLLAEAVHNKDDWFVVIGVGVNVSNKTRASLPNAASLFELTGGAPEPELLAAEIIKKTTAIIKTSAAEKESLLKRYASMCVTIGKRVKIITVTGEFSGIAEGIDNNAALLVRREDGSVETVFSGDVRTEYADE
ncbi:MAG: biotin--[acetyl-CoA-carboxylase] ligase [Oscillospiraceae bacterium]|nr:biotin--[acetyl-CoA-carboxylase] ligase [Oscillospiraceae bacterium]